LLHIGEQSCRGDSINGVFIWSSYWLNRTDKSFNCIQLSVAPWISHRSAGKPSPWLGAKPWGTVALFKSDINNLKLGIGVVTSLKRSASLPDVPTFAEAGGVPGYEAGTWFGLIAPTGTPPAIVARLHAEISKSLQTPELQQKFAGQDATIVNSTPQEFDKLMREEDALWYPLIKKLGIKAE